MISSARKTRTDKGLVHLHKETFGHHFQSSKCRNRRESYIRVKSAVTEKVNTALIRKISTQKEKIKVLIPEDSINDYGIEIVNNNESKYTADIFLDSFM